MLTYPQSHLTVAALIALATLSPTAGVAAYWMREVRDLEKSHGWNMDRFDWPGFLWPTIGLGPFAVAEIAAKAWLIWQWVAV